MIISNSKKFIFVHIMKAAGSSVTRALDPVLKWNDVLIGPTPLGEKIQEPYNDRFHLYKHSSAMQIQQVVGKDIWHEYFSFTFVRHPYSRAESLYNWIAGMVKSQGALRFFPIRRIRKKPFWNFPGTRAYLETKNFSEFIRNDKLVKAAIGFRPQADWIQNENGEMIVDFIGKVENLQADFQFITKKIECGDVTLSAYNQSKVKQQRIFKRDDFEYLQDRFQKDFEQLGYNPDPEKYRNQKGF